MLSALFSERYVLSTYFANALLTAARYAALVMVSDGQRETGAEPKGERQSMDVIYDLHSWSKQRREEALTEAHSGGHWLRRRRGIAGHALGYVTWSPP